MKSALTRAIERTERAKREELRNEHSVSRASHAGPRHCGGSPVHREEAVSYLDSPEHKVGSAAFDLRMVISELWEMRLKPETADLVISEKYSLDLAHQALSALVEDVRVALENMKEAAE